MYKKAASTVLVDQNRIMSIFSLLISNVGNLRIETIIGTDTGAAALIAVPKPQDPSAGSSSSYCRYFEKRSRSE